MKKSAKKISIRDVTLREGLDVPGLYFSLDQRIKIANLLAKANIAEVEILAPAKVSQDLLVAKQLKSKEIGSKTSGLIYGFSAQASKEIEDVALVLDRFDILMPLSPKRAPHNFIEKEKLLYQVLENALACNSRVGVGFPHCLHVEFDSLSKISKESVERGAKRITIYDTDGKADPFVIHDLIRRLRQEIDTELFFHAHNDLGLATANSLAAVYAGADGLDLSVNGLGDRAGNASLEQLVMNLYLNNVDCGVSPASLMELSKAVEQESGISIPKLAPIVGEYSFFHKSPAHLDNPLIFEAFDPNLVGKARKKEIV